MFDCLFPDMTAYNQLAASMLAKSNGKTWGEWLRSLTQDEFNLQVNYSAGRNATIHLWEDIKDVLGHSDYWYSDTDCE